VTFVGLLLLAAVVGGAYLAWVWGPVYFLHYEVKQVVREHMNQAVRDQDDAALVDRMVRKLASLAQEEGVDAYGEAALVPSVVVAPAEVEWERDPDARPPMVRVRFEYERTVTYPILGRRGSKLFSVDLASDLTRPDWGPER
jgi:hypothetical protein